jgi:hypothetical protein
MNLFVRCSFAFVVFVFVVVLASVAPYGLRLAWSTRFLSLSSLHPHFRLLAQVTLAANVLSSGPLNLLFASSVPPSYNFNPTHPFNLTTPFDPCFLYQPFISYPSS